MADCAMSRVPKRINAHAIPERLPPRIIKTSSTWPYFSKTCLRSSSELPGGQPPTNNLFSALGSVPETMGMPLMSARRKESTGSKMRRLSNEMWRPTPSFRAIFHENAQNAGVHSLCGSRQATLRDDRNFSATPPTN